MRHFPVDVFLFFAGTLGLLSWTAEVEIFRLGIPSIYEHVLAYALLASVIIAGKGFRAPSLPEIILVIIMAAFIEALKFSISFRHPKTSDFFADMLGFFAILIVIYVLKNIAHLTRRAIQFLPFSFVGSVNY